MALAGATHTGSPFCWDLAVRRGLGRLVRFRGTGSLLYHLGDHILNPRASTAWECTDSCAQRCTVFVQNSQDMHHPSRIRLLFAHDFKVGSDPYGSRDEARVD